MAGSQTGFLKSNVPKAKMEDDNKCTVYHVLISQAGKIKLLMKRHDVVAVQVGRCFTISLVSMLVW